MPKNTIPSYTSLFLYRQGLKFKPSQNFIDKFKEFYNKELEDRHKKNNKNNIAYIDDDTAIFMINCILEGIVHCLDFGFNVIFKRLFVFTQKVTDYKLNSKKKHKSVFAENIKKINFRPVSRIVLDIKDNMNKDNKKYQDFIEAKKDCYKKIKKYYKEFYGKEDWWRDEV